MPGEQGVEGDLPVVGNIGDSVSRTVPNLTGDRGGTLAQLEGQRRTRERLAVDRLDHVDLHLAGVAGGVGSGVGAGVRPPSV